jgi:hypothetical protein
MNESMDSFGVGDAMLYMQTVELCQGPLNEEWLVVRLWLRCNLEDGD